MHHAIALAAVAAALPCALHAQREFPIAPNARVRVSAPELGLTRREGRFVGVAGDTLYFLDDAGGTRPARLPLPSITRIDLSDGYPSLGQSALRGAGVGFLAGAGVGVLLVGAGALIDARDSCSDCFISARFVGAIFGVGTTAVGTVAGAALGAVYPREQWERVDLPRWRVGASPAPDGRVALSLAVRF